MTQRLIRIEWLITSLTLLASAAALASGATRPFGGMLGGTRHTPLGRIVSMALAKSLVLLAIPASALLLPHSLIDAVSFAIGVTALPVAVVLDACLPLAAHGRA